MDLPGQAVGRGSIGRGAGLTDTAAAPKSLGGLARFLDVTFIAWVVIELLALAFLWQERSLLQDLQSDPASVSFVDVERSDDRVAAIGIVELLAYAVTATAFIWWIRRAYGNLEALRTANLPYGKGWAIGAWFVPLLNLIRPYQIVELTWIGSDPERSEETGTDWRARSGPVSLRVWWGMLVFSNVVVRFASTSSNPSIGDLLRANVVDMVSVVLTIGAALLARHLVRDITDRQRRRAARLG